MSEKAVQIGFPCPPALKARLQAAAESEGVSLAAFVRGALEAHFERPRASPVSELIQSGARLVKEKVAYHGLAWW